MFSLKVGMNISLQMKDGSLLSTVIQNYDDKANVISVNIPTKRGIYVMPPKGYSLICVHMSKQCCYNLVGVIESYSSLDNIKVMNIKLTSDVERVQRRNYFRVDWGNEVRVKIFNTYDLDKVEFEGMAYTYDLSEKGVGIVLDKSLPHNTFVEVKLNTQEIDFEFTYCVTRCYMQGDKHRIGLMLVGEIPRYERELREYIFKQQVKNAK